MTRLAEEFFTLALVIALVLFALTIAPAARPSQGTTSPSASVRPVDATTALATSLPGSPWPSWPAGPSTVTEHSPGPPEPTATARHAVGTPLLAGWATHYWNGAGIYAAAGPDLRRVLGAWRDAVVLVCAFPSGQARCSSVPLTDACACGQRRGDPTLLDLSSDAFVRLCGALSLGICRVTVEVLR